jgi:hypothetical protein
MATAQQQGLPGFEPEPAAPDAGGGRAVARAWTDGYLARCRGRPDADIPYREEASAAHSASWRACAQLLRGGDTTAAEGNGGEEIR